jgi:predicted phage terminase large subunit-like protein
MAFLAAREPEVLFTGSGGCGKTTGLLMAALVDAERADYSALLVQRTLAGPVGLADLAREWLEGTDADWDASGRAWRFPSGATLGFGHERLAYVAGQYNFVGVDDLTLFAEHEYRRLFQVLRRSRGSEVPLRMRVASSPGGPGHDWVRERFAVGMAASGLPLGRRAVFASMEENPHLDVEEYLKSLANLDLIRRGQLGRGDWSMRQGGAIFRRDWFRIVDRAPAGLRRARFWDLAATEGPSGPELLFDPDWTVGVLVGQSAEGQVYVLDVVRQRADPKGVKRLVRQTAELDGSEVTIGMEQESGASGKTVIADFRTLLAGYVFKPERPIGDKVTRARPYASYAEGGGVRIVRASWNAAFLTEHEQFPLGAHDDAVDAASGSFRLLVAAPPALDSRQRARAHFNTWLSEADA